MSIKYKNKLRLDRGLEGKWERMKIAAEPARNGNILPEPVVIEDIDRAFKDWAENSLRFYFEDKEIPTVFLFASQKFSEYMQSWKDVDDKKNFLMNFKVVSRENNPKQGSIYGDTRNIPGERMYEIYRTLTRDENRRPVILKYSMKQPYGVDITYNLSVVTNKLRMLNDFSEKMNGVFKGITAYINANGHYMSMVLENISDDSEYEIADRQYFSQTYEITVRGYIIRPEDMAVEECPLVYVPDADVMIDAPKRGGVDIEEFEPELSDGYRYRDTELSFLFQRCTGSLSATMDIASVFEKFECDNIRSFRVTKNGDEVFSWALIEGDTALGDGMRFMPGDEICVDKVLKIDALKGPATVKFYGYRPFEVEKKSE